MRVKSIVVVTVLIAAAVIYAQDVADIFNELKTKTVSVPLPVAPAPEPAAAPEVKVIPVAVAVEPAAAPEVKTTAVPAAVEPAPAIVESVAKPAVTVESDVQNVAVATEPAMGAIKGGLISLSLKDVELNSVIRLFATLSDANIIVPTLEGTTGAVKVDVNLKNVEWKPALQSILDANDLELYEKTPGSEVYSVRKKPVDAPQTLEVKIFKLNYASVSNVNEMIKTMVPMTGPASGKISVFPARNTIVVQSTPQNLLDIQAMITAVDLPRQQVVIEAKIMELADGSSEKLGIDWQMLSGYNVGVKNIGGSYNQQKMYDMHGNQYEDRENPTWLANPNTTTYDKNQTAPIFTADPNKPGSYIMTPGTPPTFTADPTHPGVYERTDGITSYVENKNTTTYDTVSKINKPTVATALGATLSADDFKLVLAALKEITGVRVVSNPKVMVSNEEKAQIYVGQKEPNIKQSTTQAQQADAVTTYNLDPERPFFEYGIKLDVTPTINTSSNITVTINPSLSRWVRDKTVGNGGTVNTFPITTEKTIKTVFSLASGQTAAIGGLTEATANDTERKVPVLGSLPLIGRFFSWSSKDKNQAETIIFVTVGLANLENINMETGLPQDSTLAMRYEASAQANRQIKAEELKILNQSEGERAQSAVQKLQNAEQKRLEKKNK